MGCFQPSLHCWCPPATTQAEITGHRARLRPQFEQDTREGLKFVFVDPGWLCGGEAKHPKPAFLYNLISSPGTVHRDHAKERRKS